MSAELPPVRPFAKLLWTHYYYYYCFTFSDTDLGSRELQKEQKQAGMDKFLVSYIRVLIQCSTGKGWTKSNFRNETSRKESFNESSRESDDRTTPLIEGVGGYSG